MLIKFFDNGALIQSVQLTENEKKTIGNGKGNPVNIVLNYPVVSRLHAEVVLKNGQLFIIDHNSTNGTYLNSGRIEPKVLKQINKGDVVAFNKTASLRALVYETANVEQPTQPSQPTQPTQSRQNNQPSQKKQTSAAPLLELLEEKNEVLIGRSKDCDYVIDSPTVSRKHCLLKKTTRGNVLKDLESRNGTYLNGKKINGETVISDNDVILVGTFMLGLEKPMKDIKEEVAVRLINLEKKFKQKIGFEALSIDIPNRQMIGIMGPSGCGKSTLLKTLTGTLSASSGQILIHGLDLITNYEYIKSHIGYVPQDDIIHKDLTVWECLYYTIKLRLPNMEEKSIKTKIEDTLAKLKVADTKDQLVGSLSGGQRKRICIAVELLNEPLILFLDEPTSPLDPQSVEEFLKIIEGLAKQGTTIVMVTHKPEDLQYFDKVLFLAKGGTPVFFGNVKEHLGYFNVSRTVDVYALLSERQSEVISKLHTRFISLNKQLAAASSDNSLSLKPNTNIFSQTYWLTRRCIQTKINDKVSTGILILQAPLIGILISLIFKQLNLPVLFFLAITAIWLGTNNSAREIVNEQHIYQRERLFNLNLFSYITSKLLVFLFLSIIQSLLIIPIIYWKFNDHALPLNNPVQMFFFVTLVTFCSSFLGLCVSGLAKNNDRVTGTIPLLLIPQIMLAGVITKVSSLPVEAISYLTISRWATEGFANLQKDVVAVVPPGQTVTDGSPPKIVNAPDLLAHQYMDKYYSKDIFHEWTSTLKLDISMLAAITILLLLFLIIGLKKKDTI